MNAVDGMQHAGDWPGRLGTALLGTQVSLMDGGRARRMAAAPGMGGSFGRSRVTLMRAGFTLTLRVTEGSSQSLSASKNTDKDVSVTALTDH